MKAIEAWSPTKFVVRGGKLTGSEDPRELGIGSRIVAGAMAERYETALRRYASGRFLDLGCGKAPLYGVYGPLSDEVLCVDWEGSAHGSLHVDQFHDLNEDLGLPSASFDTILMSDVLEHIRKPELLMARTSELLSPGGTVVIGVPFFYWLHEEPYDYFRYTRHALVAMASDSGLEVISLEESGGAPEVLADIIGKIAGRRPWAQATIVRMLQFLVNNRFSRRISESTKRQFPLGYVMVARKPSKAAPGDAPEK